MEKRAIEVKSSANPEVYVKVIPGHFATRHSHVNYCVDMTGVKSDLNSAKPRQNYFATGFLQLR